MKFLLSLTLNIIERINQAAIEGLDDEKKIRVIEDVVLRLTPGNKLNFLLYDGDYMYIHKNEPGTLYRTVSQGTAVFSTHPLDDQFWEEVPQNRLLVYRDGELIHEAQPHVNTYYHNEEKMRLQYLDHAML